MAKKICLVCGKEIGALTGKYKCKDGYICKPCFKEKGYFQNVIKYRGFRSTDNLTLKEIEAVNADVEYNIDVVENFKATYVPDIQIQFDDNNSMLIMSPDQHVSYRPHHFVVLRYDQIVDYELLQNGSSIASGGLGRAAVGGMLFGGVGAIVGASTRKQHSVCSDLQIKFTVRNYGLPSVYLHLITTDTKTNSILYKNAMTTAQNVLSKLELITKNQQPEDTQEISITNSVADKLRELKSLLDEDIITREEFDQKKGSSRKLGG